MCGRRSPGSWESASQSSGQWGRAGLPRPETRAAGRDSGPSESCSHLTPQPPSSFSPLHLETAMITVFLCLLPEYSMYIRANMFTGICLFFFQYRWWQQSHCFAPCSFHFTASVGNVSLSVQTELPVLFHSCRVFPCTAHPADPRVGSPRLGHQGVSRGAEAGCGGWL